MPGDSPLRPLYVRVQPEDNVAIVVNEGGLPAGTRFPSGLVLREDIPEAHKLSLCEIAAGKPILRYGSVIGYAEAAIPDGCWVHEERMRMPAPPRLDEVPMASATPAPLPPLEGHTFEGFVNADGSVGTETCWASRRRCSAWPPRSTSP